MIPVEDILEALDLSRAEPGTGFLEALFSRFNAKLPFENASKILRHAEITDPDEKPRTPEIFWADHLEKGTGGTCFARVAAFDALLTCLGYRTRRHLGRVRSDHDHAALSVETPAGERIADVGFPLAALLPACAGRVETPHGGLEISATPRGLRVGFEGVPEGPRELEIFGDAVSEEAYLARWRGTYAPRGPFLSTVTLRVDRGNRVLSFAGGEVRVDDLHSRLRLPLRGGRAAALAALFGIEEEVLTRAFEIAGDPAPGAAEATLTAYLEAGAPAARAFEAIASLEGYRRLIGGSAEISGEERTAAGFSLKLSAGGAEPGAAIEEDVIVEGEALRLSVIRRGGKSESRSVYQAEERGGKTWLLREAALPGAREDLLRNDSLRGRLAGTLALDLLAWGRML